MHDYELKVECVQAKDNGMAVDDIYHDIYAPKHKGYVCTLESFDRMLRVWKKKVATDKTILESANLGNKFKPYGATVQIDRNGEVVQSWIKQAANEVDYDELLQKIQQVPVADYVEPVGNDNSCGMLEIPLFDMHFGIADLDYYTETLNNLLALVYSKRWEQIFLIVGQDLFHNNDFRGNTANGTPIEKVDITKAFVNARDFYFTLIRACLAMADKVDISYSTGNHDETIGWFFFQVLKQAFGTQATFDDRTDMRKCFHWKQIFIGYGHCDKGRANAKDIRCQFTVEFPMQFADSVIREIHLGHLHTEIADGTERDVNGIMVRRLSTGNITDDWHKENGYVGNHKRFMTFEYASDWLKDIHYV